MLVLMNHLEFTTESKSTKLSIMRFWLFISFLKYSEILARTHLIALFQQDLIVLAQCNTKYNGGDILEAMDPFLPFTSLPAHIEHASIGLVL